MNKKRISTQIKKFGNRALETLKTIWVYELGFFENNLFDLKLLRAKRKKIKLKTFVIALGNEVK